MPHAVFIDHAGTATRVEAPLGKSLMQIAVDHGITGIVGDCGGSCSCATCHGYVDPAFADRLPPKSETEAFMLEALPAPTQDSRLCCQIRMQPELDGIVVRLPEEQY